jgi:hypothetical protein
MSSICAASGHNYQDLFNKSGQIFCTKCGDFSGSAIDESIGMITSGCNDNQGAGHSVLQARKLQKLSRVLCRRKLPSKSL